MELSDPQHAVVALAAFVRRRLTGVTGGLLETLTQWCGAETSGPSELSGEVAGGTAPRNARIVAAAGGPFAPSSFARARLLRQLHASGLLTEHEAEQAIELLQIASSQRGDPPIGTSISARNSPRNGTHRPAGPRVGTGDAHPVLK